jgi:hypothetical protein
MSDTSYFRYIPDFEYISRGPNKIGSSDFTKVKNFFVRGSIREDLFNNITVFDRYIIEGDDRPDNVAFKLYGDSNLDWIILLSNNIIDVYSEWPLSQINFEEYLLEKYGSFEELYSPRYYETLEIKDSQGVIIVPSGLKVSNQYIDFDRTIIKKTEVFDPIFEVTTIVEEEIENPNYLKLKPTYFEFFDYGLGKDVLYNGVIKEVTNYEYELDINEKKRQIFALKQEYISIIIDQIEENLEYKEGSDQFVTETLKRGSSIDFED